MRLRPVTAGCAECIQWQIYSGQVDGQARRGTACALQYTRSPRRVNGCGATRRGLADSIQPDTVVVSPRPDPDARQHIATTRHDSPRVVAPAVSPREHGRRAEEPCEQRALGVVATSRRSQQPRLASHASHPKRSDVTRTLQTKAFTRTARLTLTARAELEASADPPRRVSMMYCLVAVATARRRRRQTLGLSERPLPLPPKSSCKIEREKPTQTTQQRHRQRQGATGRRPHDRDLVPGSTKP